MFTVAAQSVICRCRLNGKDENTTGNKINIFLRKRFTRDSLVVLLLFIIYFLMYDCSNYTSANTTQFIRGALQSLKKWKKVEDCENKSTNSREMHPNSYIYTCMCNNSSFGIESLIINTRKGDSLWGFIFSKNYYDQYSLILYLLVLRYLLLQNQFT